MAASTLVAEEEEVQEVVATASGWVGAAGGAEADFPLFLPGCEEVFLRAVFTRLEEAFTTSPAVVLEC